MGGLQKQSIFTSKNRKKFTKLQKGYFDHILCKKCDGEDINYYDSFGYNFIMQELLKVIPPIRHTLIANKNKDFYIKLKGSDVEKAMEELVKVEEIEYIAKKETKAAKKRECKPNCVNPPLIPKSLSVF
jgi:hypothetical protein